MKELLAQILLSAAAAMWRHDPTLGEYTAATAEHELNLAFHYAAELRRWFPWLLCDFDVTKLNFSRERPDIILHRRRSNAANYLVIEIKRERSRKAVPADLEQIRSRWFTDDLRYRYGASLILDERDHRVVEVCVLFRDEPEIETTRKLSSVSLRVLPPKQSAMEKSQLPKLVEQIVAAAKENPATDTSALEREMDQQVYALYGLTPEEVTIMEESHSK